MLLLLIAVIIGIAFGYFATQNTTPVTIHVAEYALEGVPLYLVIVGSLFLGLFIAWILYVVRSVSSRVTLYGKDHAVKSANQTVADLEHRVHELEIESAQLKTKYPPPPESPTRRVA
ncbi:MAG TPA: LapA family protein [Candidatus Binatia bacterium]|nr:LapA family protein [Candidatus Binatia bacterium]